MSDRYEIIRITCKTCMSPISVTQKIVTQSELLLLKKKKVRCPFCGLVFPNYEVVKIIINQQRNYGSQTTRANNMFTDNFAYANNQPMMGIPNNQFGIPLMGMNGMGMNGMGMNGMGFNGNYQLQNMWGCPNNLNQPFILQQEDINLADCMNDYQYRQLLGILLGINN